MTRVVDAIVANCSGVSATTTALVSTPKAAAIVSRSGASSTHRSSNMSCQIIARDVLRDTLPHSTCYVNRHHLGVEVQGRGLKPASTILQSIRAALALHQVA